MSGTQPAMKIVISGSVSVGFTKTEASNMVVGLSRNIEKYTASSATKVAVGL